MLIKLLAFKEAYLQTAIQSYKKNIKGATAIEYGLIAGGISLVIVAAVFAFGSDLKGLFETMGSKMSSAAAKAK